MGFVFGSAAPVVATCIDRQAAPVLAFELLQALRPVCIPL
jgi:hypothetical protein